MFGRLRWGWLGAYYSKDICFVFSVFDKIVNSISLPVFITGLPALILLPFFGGKRHHVVHYFFFVVLFLFVAALGLNIQSKRYACILIIPFCITSSFLIVYIKNIPLCSCKWMLMISAGVFSIIFFFYMIKFFRNFRYGKSENYVYSTINTLFDQKDLTVYYFQKNNAIRYYTNKHSFPSYKENEASFCFENKEKIYPAVFDSFSSNILFVLNDKQFSSIEDELHSSDINNASYKKIGKIIISPHGNRYLVYKEKNQDSFKISESQKERIIGALENETIFAERFNTVLPIEKKQINFESLNKYHIIPDGIKSFPRDWTINTSICKEKKPFVELVNNLNSKTYLHMSSMASFPILCNNFIPNTNNKSYVLYIISKGEPGTVLSWELYLYRTKDPTKDRISLTSSKYIVCDGLSSIHRFVISQDMLNQCDSFRIQIRLMSGDIYIDYIALLYDETNQADVFSYLF